MFTLFLVAFLAAITCFQLWLTRRRREVVASLAMRTGLSFVRNVWPPEVPFADLGTWFFSPALRNIVYGRYRGHQVIAFDYIISSGRSYTRGSGVGVGNVKPDFGLPESKRYNVTQRMRWVFVSAIPRFSQLNGHLQPEELRQLWDLLIENAAPPEPSVLIRSRPGEVHIYPRHHARKPA